jgi:PAS domain S-box-containing protein/putative nucleotidyltransferase with HDIG domain
MTQRRRRYRELREAARRTNRLIGAFEHVRGASRCIVDQRCRILSQSICDRLTATGGYASARVTLADESGTLRLADGAASTRADTARTEEFAIPIEHAGKTYGHLAVTTGTGADPDPNERALLSLIADDVGRALHEVEARRQDESTGSLLDDEKVFRDCFEGVSVGMAFIRSHDAPLTVNKAFTDFLGYEKGEFDRIPAAEALERVSHPDDYKRELVLLHDLMNRRSPSYTIEKRFIRKDGRVVPGLLTTTFFFDREDDFRFGVASVQDISEHVGTREELERAYEGAIDALTVALESRDPYTAGHQRRVTQLVCAIADEIGLPEARRMGLRVASILHDIGKIAIPAEILTKPYGVSEVEYSLIKSHPAVAYDILKEIHFPWPVADIVLQHHERVDGSGYPAGLRGDAILLEAKILAVADVVEALSSHRPYRAALGIADALEHIKENRSALFEDDVVEACARVFEGGFRFEDVGSRPGGELEID